MWAVPSRRCPPRPPDAPGPRSGDGRPPRDRMGGFQPASGSAATAISCRQCPPKRRQRRCGRNQPSRGLSGVGTSHRCATANRRMGRTVWPDSHRATSARVALAPAPVCDAAVRPIPGDRLAVLAPARAVAKGCRPLWAQSSPARRHPRPSGACGHARSNSGTSPRPARRTNGSKPTRSPCGSSGLREARRTACPLPRGMARGRRSAVTLSPPRACPRSCGSALRRRSGEPRSWARDRVCRKRAAASGAPQRPPRSVPYP